jgi:hypothetical protein
MRYKTAKTQFLKGKPYNGRKYLFHSIRYRIFAIQLVKYGRLDNFGCANWLWEQIKAEPLTTWDEFDVKYRPISDQIREEFSQLLTGKLQ